MTTPINTTPSKWQALSGISAAVLFGGYLYNLSQIGNSVPTIIGVAATSFFSSSIANASLAKIEEKGKALPFVNRLSFLSNRVIKPIIKTALHASFTTLACKAYAKMAFSSYSMMGRAMIYGVQVSFSRYLWPMESSDGEVLSKKVTVRLGAEAITNIGLTLLFHNPVLSFGAASLVSNLVSKVAERFFIKEEILPPASPKPVENQPVEETPVGSSEVSVESTPTGDLLTRASRTEDPLTPIPFRPDEGMLSPDVPQTERSFQEKEALRAELEGKLESYWASILEALDKQTEDQVIVLGSKYDKEFSGFEGQIMIPDTTEIFVIDRKILNSEEWIENRLVNLIQDDKLFAYMRRHDCYILAKTEGAYRELLKTHEEKSNPAFQTPVVGTMKKRDPYRPVTKGVIEFVEKLIAGYRKSIKTTDAPEIKTKQDLLVEALKRAFISNWRRDRHDSFKEMIVGFIPKEVLHRVSDKWPTHQELEDAKEFLVSILGNEKVFAPSTISWDSSLEAFTFTLTSHDVAGRPLGISKLIERRIRVEARE